MKTSSALATVVFGVVLATCVSTTWSVNLDAQTTKELPDSATRRRIQPLPALGSAPETGLQFGATVLAVWEPAPYRKTRPTSLQASALRTRKNQTSIGIDADHWTEGNRRRFAGSLQWRQFPLPFYGIGDRTSSDAKEIFTPKGITATFTAQQRVRDAWYAFSTLTHANQTITFDSAGLLNAGTVSGALTGTTGGRVTELTVGLQRDTRDNLFAPRSGRWLNVGYSRSVDGVLSDFSYGRLRVDARGYTTLTGEHVLATQMVVVAVDGRAPFDRLALIGGGDIMRGYDLGRYRDRVSATAQTEYRSPLHRRVGAVLFAGAGISAPSVDALGDRLLLPTYGAGLRFQIDKVQRTGVRVDYGRGRDGASGLYIGFNQAF